MDIFAYLEGMAAQHGPSGHEASVAQWLSERFRPLCDSVTIDALYNVIAVKKATLPTPDGSPAPRVMLCAHQDEIALMVSDILPDGTLRMGSVGGVDPRILPASTVTVHATGEGETRKLNGVVGALPPHLMSAEDRTKAYTREELFVDLCMAPEKVKKLVNVGDLITLQGPAVKLLNHRAAAKTVDDRSCVGCLLLAAERLQKMQHMCDIYFVASSQEEVGGRGAAVASYTVDPDLAVVLDVVIGATYGMIAGYLGGKVDFVMQRFVEVLTSIPNLIIMMLLLLVLEPGIPAICLALAMTGWVNMSRIVRAQVLKLKSEEYVLASRTLGAPVSSILFKDILPNTMGQIIITFMLSVPNAIFFEAFLAFIGLGVPIPMASLGTLINDGYKSAMLYPAQVLLPALVLSILMLSFNLLGDGLRDAFDPKLRR